MIFFNTVTVNFWFYAQKLSLNDWFNQSFTFWNFFTGTFFLAKNFCLNHLLQENADSRSVIENDVVKQWLWF